MHEEVLDNGLSVVVVPMDSGGLVAYWSIVRTGSRDEYEPGRSGFTHVFEHRVSTGASTPRSRFPESLSIQKILGSFGSKDRYRLQEIRNLRAVTYLEDYRQAAARHRWGIVGAVACDLGRRRVLFAGGLDDESAERVARLMTERLESVMDSSEHALGPQ